MSILSSVLDTLGIGHGLPDPLPPDPFPLLRSWHDEAARDKRIADANAMVLATCSATGDPSARVVLCKSIEDARGSLVFYTSYESRKGRELESNPRAACVFYWEEFGRQARVEGRVERVGAAESDEYFATRPLLSRIGASASLQSRPMARRTDLLDRVLAVIKEIGAAPHELLTAGGPKIPRPAAWGGYRIHATRVELWAASKGRLHDRAAWTRDRAGGGWTATRLYP
ncbi:MAG TPA: pyridoxamine 5'-phosphate oxidase [Phycisphaerales bacterium]|nr:pyridoxamine 5'-phosphate oxidase [Phycisphaerales bacterium]